MLDFLIPDAVAARYTEWCDWCADKRDSVRFVPYRRDELGKVIWANPTEAPEEVLEEAVKFVASRYVAALLQCGLSPTDRQAEFMTDCIIFGHIAINNLMRLQGGSNNGS